MMQLNDMTEMDFDEENEQIEEEAESMLGMMVRPSPTTTSWTTTSRPSLIRPPAHRPRPGSRRLSLPRPHRRTRTSRSSRTAAPEATRARLAGPAEAEGRREREIMANELPDPKDPHAKNIVAAFHHAISILDQTEPQIRDLIESELMDVAGINGGKVKDAMLATDTLVQKIMALRLVAIKQAFRHLRDNLPSDL
jgi:hypothetical protein